MKSLQTSIIITLLCLSTKALGYELPKAFSCSLTCKNQGITYEIKCFYTESKVRFDSKFSGKTITSILDEDNSVIKTNIAGKVLGMPLDSQYTTAIILPSKKWTLINEFSADGVMVLKLTSQGIFMGKPADNILLVNKETEIPLKLVFQGLEYTVSDFVIGEQGEKLFELE